ncbi:MAG TPA: hypothetical protein VEJ84_02310, partial [Acidimicrobiales bacterium]|nr:hypothetical protein [Acidimicrobiales bacterium]
MPRPPPAASGRRSAPGPARATEGRTRRSRAPRAPGRSALAARDDERRARRRRSASAALLGVVAFAAVASWALQQVGVVPLAGGPWPLLAIGIGAGGAAVAVWPRFDPDRWARGAAGEV